MNQKILVTGATGLIGKKLVNELCLQGAFVKIISTKKKRAKTSFEKTYAIQFFEWSAYNTPHSLAALMEETDTIINLAGTNVGEKRWGKKFKDEIYNSRVETTKLIVESIGLCKQKPKCLINASAVGIYGFRGDEVLDETATSGDDFLARVCIDWESEAMKAVQLNVRAVFIRTGVVLDKKEGALPKILTPYRFYIGTYYGSGKQWLSWIHIDDIINLYISAINDVKLFGAVNGCSPDAVTNKKFNKTVGEVLKSKLSLPIPAFILRIAAGEFASNLLSGQRVFPKKAVAAGFVFKYPYLKEALTDLLRK